MIYLIQEYYAYSTVYSQALYATHEGRADTHQGGGAFAMWQWVLASRRGSHYHRANIIIRGAMT